MVGLAASAANSCWMSALGGASRSASPHVKSYIGHRGVAGDLVAARAAVEVAVEPGVDRLGEQLGVAERVEHPLGGDRVLVVAGVADERPAGPVRPAEEVVVAAGEPEPLDPLAPGHPRGEAGHVGERLEERPRSGPVAVRLAEGDLLGDERERRRWSEW